MDEVVLGRKDSWWHSKIQKYSTNTVQIQLERAGSHNTQGIQYKYGDGEYGKDTVQIRYYSTNTITVQISDCD